MIINVCWRRKDKEIEAEPCVIQDVIELSESEYSRFYQNLLDDYDFIAEHQDAMFHEKGQDHALLVLGESQTDGILIRSEGTNYARYSAFIPNARELIQSDIKQLADYCIREGTENGRLPMKNYPITLIKRQSAMKMDLENYSVKNYSREKKSMNSL